MIRRWRTGCLAVVASAALIAGTFSVNDSLASWRDDEWDAAVVGTVDCSPEGSAFLTRAQGRLLDGSLLPVDLGAVATVSGVTVTNDGAVAAPDPAAATSVGDSAFVNPLDVSALSLVNLPLTGTSLASFLLLDLDNEVGVLNQYAKARSDGWTLGASGVVNDSGSVMTANAPGGGTPTLGTLRLSALVDSLTGEAISDVVSGVADLSLEIGAVAGRAGFEACDELWSGDLASSLSREYAIAGLDATIDSPAVAGLSGVLDSALDDIETLVNGLAGNAGVVNGITAGVGQLLTGLLGTLELGSVSLVGPSVDVDLSAARALATATIADPEETVSLDLGTGEVSVDLASLMGQAYGGQGFNGSQQYGLNGLDPNTQLVVNAPVTNALVAALTAALDGWVEDVVATVESALYAADVTVRIDITLRALLVPVATVRVDVAGTLQELLDNEATVSASLSLLGGSCSLVNPVACLVDSLTAGILGALTAGVAPMVGGVLEDVIFAPTGPVGTLGATLSAATAPVIDVLAQVLVGYLGVDGLVALRANLQNDPVGGGLTYPDWESGPDAVPADRYAVAALGVGVVDALGPSSNVNLELARGEVGVNCLVGGAWDLAGRCAGYGPP